MASLWQDGGRAGWIAVLTWWTFTFVWMGTTKGWGVMLPTLQHQLGADTWLLGWISSTVVGVSGIIGERFTPVRVFVSTSPVHNQETDGSRDWGLGVGNYDGG